MKREASKSLKNNCDVSVSTSKSQSISRMNTRKIPEILKHSNPNKENMGDSITTIKNRKEKNHQGELPLNDRYEDTNSNNRPSSMM